ncbi:DUF6233 domain-containing protein [Streptomyces sp. DG2A-72]|uniref:DUF6233 domain-containing protein n=1 Tax=Streptomyces sp. DG2A-72 TaxID=3051386 RepID=UPI00265BA4F7|nr:DUF6233 domain-containing protein [Streptomyces sp. DG2A-72]MDO0936488.1 DUF6233 domain-containing protein [Streptomyces sp. DG2A-72]
MSQLPPDPARLGVILAFLDRQIAEIETVAIYLRLQRNTVREALMRAERPQPQRTKPPPKGAGPLTGFAPPASKNVGFVVQQKRTPNGPEPALIHMADCTMIEGTPHRIRADEARAALTDPNIEPCQFCRPDTELGTDLA